MNGKVRTGVLVMVIAIPFFLILYFSNTLGKVPRPKPPRRQHPVGVQDIVNDKGEKEKDTLYHVVPNMTLQTQLGDSLTLDSLRGKIYVADFFFASCPGICPKMNAQMQRVQKAFIKDDALRIISFTVDPTRDTLAALKQYANRHDAVAGKWVFLRGSKEQIYELATDGFFITAKDDDGSPDPVHSEKLVLVDWDGHIRGYYDGTDSARVNQMMGDIVLLLKEIEKGFSFRKEGRKKR